MSVLENNGSIGQLYSLFGTMIKVCHIITKLELGGAQQNTLFTVSHLDRDQFSPVLITGRGGILDAEAAKMQGVKIYFTGSVIRDIRPWKDLTAFLEIYRILKTERPAIVHTHSSKAGILGRWAAWFAGVPVIIHTIHGFGFNDFQPWPLRFLLILIEKLTSPVTDRFVVVTTEDRKKGLHYGIGDPDRYTVIRSGIDTSLYKSAFDGAGDLRASLGIAAGLKIVTTIGAFKPQKNLADFLGIARGVLDKAPDTRFLLVGDGGQRPILEARRAQLRLEGSVVFLGWRRDIPAVLAITDVFVMTSLWEGLPRSILEAMCAAKPVVANAVDGVREIIREGETGYLIAPHDLDAMAARVISILETPALAAKLGENARRIITGEYDLYHMVRQQEEMYLKETKRGNK